MPLAKLDLLERSDVVKRVLRVLLLLLFHGKMIAVATTDNGTNNMIKVNERWKNRKMALCCCSHVEQVIKSTMKRVNNNSSVNLLPRVLRAV